MDENIQSDGVGSADGQIASTSTANDKVCLLAKDRHSFVTCRYLDSLGENLIPIGSFELGTIPDTSSIENLGQSEDRQIILKVTEGADDSQIYCTARNEKKKRRKSYRPMLRAVAAIHLSEKGKRFLWPPVCAASLSGFEIRWDLKGNDVHLHVFFKESFLFDHDIYKTDLIRKLVRGGYHTCAACVVCCVFPEFTEAIRRCLRYWKKEAVVGYRENFDEFFDMIRENRENAPRYQLKLDSLGTKLLPYQEDAVNFMVHREMCPGLSHGELLRFVKLPTEPALFLFPCLGIFVRNIENVPIEPYFGGGILADEMGLGKTVEVLGLVLTHTRDSAPPALNEDLQEERPGPSQTRLSDLVFASATDPSEAPDLPPPRKRMCVDGTTEPGRKGRVFIPCDRCGVHYRKSEVHWSETLVSQKEQFHCASCIVESDMIFDVSATLIVVPEALLHQWYEEIRRLCSDIAVDIYYGVGVEGYKHPIYLDTKNVILCTYETLQKEIHYNPDSLRTMKRGRQATTQISPSPLLAINFWRICLDESQLVASKVRAAAKMCSLLRSRFRWCVTGTPLSTSVNDLHGMLSFISIFPYYIDAIWDHYFFNPWTVSHNSSMLVPLMSQIMWRNAKKDVADQLGDIERVNNLVELSFSPIEERLYATKIEKSKERIRTILDVLCSAYAASTPLSRLPSAIVDAIFFVINDIRASILAGESHTKRKDLNCISDYRIFSPKLIVRKLFEDARLSVIQRHRELIANRNALAGIHWLISDLDGAFLWYQRSFRVRNQQIHLNQLLDAKEEEDYQQVKCEENVEEDGDLDDSKPCKPLSIDVLQVVHIERNLSELQQHCEEAAKYYQESGIIEFAQRRRYHYERAEVMAFKRVKSKWNEIDCEWATLDSAFAALEMAYVIMLDRLFRSIEFNGLKDMPHSKLHAFDYLLWFKESTATFRGDLLRMRAAVQAMTSPFETEAETTDHLLTTAETCYSPQTHSADYQKMVACSRQFPSADESKRENSENERDDTCCCPLCEIKEVLKESTEGYGAQVELCARAATHKRFLKRLFRQSSSRVTSSVKELYDGLLEWFDLTTKLVRTGRELTTVTEELLNRERELVSGAVRFQRGMSITIPYSASPVILNDETISVALRAFSAAEKEACTLLAASVTSLRYLNTLRREGENGSRDCPCCFSDMEKMWIVFPCAHTICTVCIKKLKTISPGVNCILCVTCRRPCPVDGIMYVSNNRDDLIPNIHLTVKFDGIIRLLNELVSDDSAKILVFTSIVAVIRPFAALLKLLKLPFLLLDKGSKSKTLSQFRHDPKMKILLLSLRMGANGLNLTEANHVVFMEPITEKSVLMQAVGRVDRIGQRRKITVHNFIVKGSIEEEIYTIVSNGKEQSRWSLDTLYQVFGIERPSQCNTTAAAAVQAVQHGEG
ncbi:hypothetical protein Q1695_004962 [Nippostrongylus brasiliensis]|nr:hypothetical protein Q1695_004962 [Nippostrongylus brasiliensis]